MVARKQVNLSPPPRGDDDREEEEDEEYGNQQAPSSDELHLAGRQQARGESNSSTLANCATQADCGSREQMTANSRGKQAAGRKRQQPSQKIAARGQSKPQVAHRLSLPLASGAGDCCCCSYENCCECAESLGRVKMHKLKSLISLKNQQQRNRPRSQELVSTLRSSRPPTEPAERCEDARPEVERATAAQASDECLKCQLIERWARVSNQARLLKVGRGNSRSPSSAASSSSSLSLSGDLRFRARARIVDTPTPCSSPAPSSSNSPLRDAAPLPADEAHGKRPTSSNGKKRLAPRPPPLNKNATTTAVAGEPLESRLLSESEVNSIEHCLKSHKSALYVCGCLANLYFTKTHLVDNGRSSRASSDEWRLNQTGVPVLIFDSGLAKNRNRKRLSISLVERGSGFVLWSDTIDHLSNYRAFNPQLHSVALLEGKSNHQPAITRDINNNNNNNENCDTFHVMYLSSNHRIMVGLSFDHALCARLFLAQIELISADPSNIALTGPKLPRALRGKAKTNGATGTNIHMGNHQQASRFLLNSSRSRHLNLNQASRTRFVVGKLLGARYSRTNQQQPESSASAQPNAEGASTWSNTLKRVALRKFSSGGAVGATQQAASIVNKQGVQLGAGVSASEARILSTFKPRPLAQMAATGRLWCASSTNANKLRASNRISGSTKSTYSLKRRGWLPRRAKAGGGDQQRPASNLARLPRKCDISAPCLFQHVTSVDLEGLNELYSRSFLLGGSQAGEPTVTGSDSNFTSGEQNSTQLISTKGSRTSDLDSRHSIGEQLEQRATIRDEAEGKLTSKQTLKSPSLTSAGSCYSSASISPASSECGTTTTTTTGAIASETRATSCAAAAGAAQRNATSQQPQRAGRTLLMTGTRKPLMPAAPRPPIPPPKPPARGASYQQLPAAGKGDASIKISVVKTARRLSGPTRPVLEALKQQQQRHVQEQQRVSSAAATTRGNIKSLIEELQAHASSDLIDVKRRLMADIAGQVAQARSQSRTPITSTFKSPNENQRRPCPSSCSPPLDDGATANTISHL